MSTESFRPTTTANGSGSFTFGAELIDDNNVLYATAVNAGNESDPSNSVSVVYNNTISRTQSGTISSYTVWTPGNPAQPYVVSANLTIAVGGKLVLQPGATLKFASGTSLTASGELKVVGSSTSPVTFTCNGGSCSRGSWAGIKVTAGTGTVIDGALVQWAIRGVDVSVGASAQVKYSTIKDFSDAGIYLTGSTGSTLIDSNLIDNLNDQQTCIYLYDGSPLIVGNTLRNCQYGLYVLRSSTATVNGGNLITSNLTGVLVNGGSSFTPQPVMTGNQIYGSSSYNYQASGFANGAQNVKLNATGNWWGSTDATTIGNGIYDLTDSYTSTSIPTVDYSNFLDGPSGAPVAGNYLLGPLTASATTLTAGATYQVLGTLFVPSGKSLTVPAGASLRFHGTPTRLVVDGTLSIQGTSGNLVTLTSGRATPARGDWQGVLIRSGATSPLIEYALIEWATRGVEINHPASTVRYNTIRNFSDAGIYVANSSTSNQLTGNLIDNLNDQQTCIYLYDGSPLIVGNTLRNCQYGLYVLRSSTATVNGGNLITSNLTGVLVNGGSSFTPQPVMTGNQIYGNSSYNYQASGFANGAQNVKLNATGNWWGSTDATTIGNGIYDLTDSYTSTTQPTVDYSSFLDGPSGAPVAGNYLIGPLTAASTTLTAGATYQVLGTLIVPSGKSLTVPAGASLRFHGTPTRLIVDGTLQILGTASSRVRLTSGRIDPAKGDWPGVLVRSTATNVLIDYAIIEWMARGVDVESAAADIKNSLIHNFSDGAIRMTNALAGSEIVSNYIDNYTNAGDGIYLSASSPLVQGNRIHRTYRAIYIAGAASPTISANTLTGNAFGIYLYGSNSNSATAVPNPVITGNDIFGNTSSQIEVNAYGASNPVVINATGNWWGTTTPQAGQQIRFSSGSPTTALNFSNWATAPLTGPTAGNVTLTEYYFSPNADSVKDTTTVQGTLSQSGNWTVNIKAAGGTVVRSYTGSGTSISVAWDGRNGSSQMQADGLYDCEVTLPGSPDPVVVGSRVVVLDNTSPSAAISSPAASTTLQNVVSVPVNGSAADAYLINYTLDYGAGSSPSSWTSITSQQTSGVANGLLGTWVVSSIDGSVGLANGLYTLRVRNSDKAGNVGQTTIPVTLDNILISAVSQNLQVIKPTQSEQLQVNFTLSMPSTAYLRIYPEQGGALIKEVSQVFATGGAKSLSWDGRNLSGSYVAEEAYSYVLYVTDGTRNATYDPPIPAPGYGGASGVVDPTYNANRNDFLITNYTISSKSRVRMWVTPTGQPTFYPISWKPYPAGTHPLVWDGRDPSGNIVTGFVSIFFDFPLFLKPASVIVRNSSPVITGTGVAPNVEVKSNPFKATHSFEQISKITYRVDQDSYVTVKLLPPGIFDPASPQAIVLMNNQLKLAQSGGAPVDHLVEWKGYNDTDTNDILVANEGTYTFAIEATSVANGAYSLYRGALQLWQ